LLPVEKFIYGQRVTGTRVFKTQQTAANRYYDLRFAPDDPPSCIAGWQIGKRQRRTIGTDHIFCSGIWPGGHENLLRRNKNFEADRSCSKLIIRDGEAAKSVNFIHFISDLIRTFAAFRFIFRKAAKPIRLVR
jgi:hypothetical protein